MGQSGEKRSLNACPHKVVIQREEGSCAEGRPHAKIRNFRALVTKGLLHMLVRHCSREDLFKPCLENQTSNSYVYYNELMTNGICSLCQVQGWSLNGDLLLLWCRCETAAVVVVVAMYSHMALFVWPHNQK